MLRITTSACLLCLISGNLVAAQDWPQFRGVEGRAQAQTIGLPLEFQLADATWRVELAGTGASSPVVRDGRVFVTSALDEPHVRIVQCLDAIEGTELWATELPFEPYGIHELNSFAASSPVVDDQRVYFAWPDGETLRALALDHDGEPVWSRALGSYFVNHGGGSSPVLVDGTLVIANDHEGEESFLVGLDPETGAERWRRERETSSGSFATPVVYRDAEGRVQVIFASTSHGLTSLEPATGKLLWEIEGLFTKRCVGTPCVNGEMIFATAGIGGGGQESAAVHIPRQGAQARLQYRARRSLPYVPSPVSSGDRIYTFSDGGIVSSLRAETGNVIWSERVDGEFFGSPILVGERLYAMSKQGVLFAIAADDEFRLLSAIDLGEPSNATPAVAGGVLYLRTDRHLVAVRGPRGD